MAKKIRPMNPNQASDYGSEKCPVCGGCGWEPYSEMNNDAYAEPTEINYARPCPKCIGIRRSGDRTGIPDEYLDADITKFKFDSYSVDMTNMQKLVKFFFESFKECQRKGKGLYLWSKTPGSGKTFLACCVARSVMTKYDLQMRFITAPDYIALVGENIKRERGETDTSRVYRECALLVLDDIGTQIDKPWQQQEMYKLIDERKRCNRVTIFTSNMPIEQLNVDDRTRSRITGMTVVLQMPEQSIRLQNAKREQDEFLKSIFQM